MSIVSKWVVVLLTICIYMVPEVYGQTILIRDSETGKPVEGVVIRIIASARAEISDAYGQAAIPEGYTEDKSLLVTHTAYSTEVLTGKLPDVIFLETKTYGLQEVEVYGFGDRRALLGTEGPVVGLTSQDIERFQTQTLLPAVNYVPGVRLEERAAGSYRVAIRGTLLRSPFGVRNVKVYLNGLPFTEANGNTPLNLIDPALMGSVEILKGPSGSRFGAGLGGVIRLEGIHEDGPFLSVIAQTGSYGMQKFSLQGRVTDSLHSHSVAFARQQSDGYRDHNALERESVFYQGRFSTGEKESLYVDLLYSDLFYEIPGGLTRAQNDEDRRQGRPGSEEQNASIGLEAAWGGVRHEKVWESGVETHVGIYGYGSFFNHPFITDYKREHQVAGGGRGTARKTWGGFTLSGGGEYQKEIISARNLGNVNGQPDTLRFDDEIANKSWLAFLSAGYTWPRLEVSAGVSVNNLSYSLYRILDAAGDTSYTVNRDFADVWSPRVAVSYRLTDRLYSHASVSYGFSPPTLDEFRTNEGSIDRSLEAEKGINTEVGVRGYIAEGLSVDVSGFYLRQKETIVTRTASSGVVLFDNAGSTDQYGVEGLIQYIKRFKALYWIKGWMIQASYTGYNFRFEDYVKNETDFSGNRLPGAAPHRLTFLTDLTIQKGFYLNGGYTNTAPIPLDDGNTVYSDRVHMVRVKAGWKGIVGNRLRLDVFGGSDNALNRTFSLGNDLNAFGGRYFQPAPDRTFYAGLTLSYFRTSQER
ncbi:TonB-dependent receptor [Roseivirga sp. BDSF3-8]|uniref:TonB-dependent receptor n=1 Tax=Roseivirga sp. BDSF3-8 TaxID=3241598 RepID=UPI0035326FD6